AGLALPVSAPDGLIGFASSDRGAPDEARRLVDEASRFARASAALDPERSLVVFELPAGGRQILPGSARPLAATPTAEQSRALLEAQREAQALATGFSVRSAHAVVDEQWRVVRSDGADVAFSTAHAFVRHEFTARSASG